jgi:hypothetical protein
MDPILSDPAGRSDASMENPDSPLATIRLARYHDINPDNRRWMARIPRSLAAWTLPRAAVGPRLSLETLRCHGRTNRRRS